MSRLKTFGKYALMIIGFYILSNILIFIGLNTNYDEITNVGNLPEQIEVYRAEATTVNGRIKGKVSNIDKLSDKYLKVELYSNTNTLMGTKYYSLAEIKEESKEGEFIIYFKSERIKEYSLSIVDEKEEKKQLSLDSFLTEDVKKTAIVGLLIKMCIL